MKLPSQFEQDLAKEYCTKRPLVRPSTTIKKCVLCTLIFEAAAAFLALAWFFGLNWLGDFSFFSGMLAFRQGKPVAAYFLFLLGINLVLAICLSRMILIGAVRLYQRYADEDIRRRCICMPTCSEYTILAIRHYGPVMGGIMSFVRLFFHCRGSIYSIDYPFLRYGKHYSRRK